MVIQQIILCFTVPPVITETGEGTSHTVGAGQSVSLTCGASGTPQPVLTWMKDGIRLTARDGLEIETTFTNTTHMTSVLEIVKAAPSDAGTYTCVAVNDAQTVTVSYSIEVNDSKYYNDCMHVPITESDVKYIPPYTRIMYILSCTKEQ